MNLGKRDMRLLREALHEGIAQNEGLLDAHCDHFPVKWRPKRGQARACRQFQRRIDRYRELLRKLAPLVSLVSVERDGDGR